MVTDAPMYAFLTDLAVPPYLAVISGKRIASGDLTEEQIINTISQYQPEQVLSYSLRFSKCAGIFG